MGVKKAKVFTISSVKGGTGKTTTALNLAGVFANRFRFIQWWHRFIFKY